MGLGKLLHGHAEHADGGGTIDRPRAYEIVASLGFHGRRRKIFTRLAAMAGVRPGDRVLDVGCGTGYFTRILSRAAGARGHVTGIDAAPQMIEFASRRAPGNCTYVIAEGQSLGNADGSFDVVVSTLAIHHIPESARGSAMREMFRVLRPGGRLLIAEFRPPTGRVAAYLSRLASGPAMGRPPRDLLGDLIPSAGFRVEAEGDLRPMLYYVRAVRPQ